MGRRPFRRAAGAPWPEQLGDLGAAVGDDEAGARHTRTAEDEVRAQPETLLGAAVWRIDAPLGRIDEHDAGAVNEAGSGLAEEAVSW